MNDQIREVCLDGEHLTIDTAAGVARNHHTVTIASESLVKMQASRKLLDTWVESEQIVYGITTGFGPFVSTLIPKKYQSDLQQNLIRSHATNVGPVFSREETRAAMLLRINAFSKGVSAIRLETVELLRAMLNKGIHPRIPQWGSVGASGDLTPSSHIALALMGEGNVEYEGVVMPASEAFKKTGLTPVTFMAKEGLALINGTTMMTGVGMLQVHDAWNLVQTAEVISAMGFEALHGSLEPLNEIGQQAKPHPGQLASARHLRQLLEGTKLVWSAEELAKVRADLQKRMKEEDDVIETNIPLQNVYSLRATPQILGAVRDALEYITARITTEMNSANDNPLFFADHDLSYQGAQFHGQPVAMPMDMLSISLTEIGVLSERRLNKLLDPVRNSGLSPFLARGKSGLRCGLEGAQYVATALVAECRTLCNPASIQSIPSNGENQDVVSMGLVAARKARDIKERLEYILAVELLGVCEAFEERDKSKMAPATRAVYDLVRSQVAAYNEDRVMYPNIETIQKIIHSGDVFFASQPKDVVASLSYEQR